MANIKEYTDQIATAIYGEEVRGSIIGALEKVNDDNDSYAELKAEVQTMHDTVVADTATVESAVSSIGTSVEDCQGYAESAAASISTVQGYRNESETFRNQAEQYAKEAEAAAHVEIATTSKAGIVKPDGTTITVDSDGTIHSTATGGVSDYDDLDNRPSINGVTLSGNKTTSDLSISYNDLTNKPTIPSEITIDSAMSDTSTNPVQNKVVKEAIDNATPSIASASTAGLVKPDGTTITITEDGTISSVGGGSSSGWEWIGSTTGTGTVAYDGLAYSEVFIVVKVGSYDCIHFSAPIISVATATNYRQGSYYNTATYYDARIQIAANGSHIISCMANGSNVTTSSTLTVYGRK